MAVFRFGRSGYTVSKYGRYGTFVSLVLPDELIHEILFFLPPDDPALLVRLSILSKPWHRLLSHPSFHQRYRKLHRKAPMLGFLYNEFFNPSEFASSFVPATESCPPSIPGYKLPNFVVNDCRHRHVLGCVCLFEGLFPTKLMEWTTTAYLYSSQTGEWTVPTPGLNLDGYVIKMHNVLVGGALYFLLTYGPHGTQILKYDIGRHRLSVIEPPAAAAVLNHGTVLIAAHDGMLGIGHLNNLSFCLWTRKAGPDGTVVAWTQDIVIDLATFLPIGYPVIKV
ncbi:hypothetical protein BRADI_1g58606v3 [Brachypodium distachyon]|uniref:F-box domain-containing protein n=1 Tax=Brachypodium distachyon TaxID=15368 RepID=A0A0Q3LDJ6_BRADI|nr:hypothetical protein BRADI_1g58606v3 [Brachypodium distachyon]